MGWIQLTRDSVKWRARVGKAVNLEVLQKLGRRASDASDLFLRGGGGSGLDSQPSSPITLTEALRYFPQLFQVNIGVVHYMRPKCFHRRPYQHITRCYDATCSLS
jgi:hypothetical protein